MTRAKPEMIDEKIKCPFCKKGDIDIVRTLDWYSEGRAHSAGRSAMIPHYHPEKVEIRNKCPECGKSKSDIRYAMEHGTPEEHKAVVERMKKSGLPTQLEF